MADPEIPEVRAERQRQDRPGANARYDRSLGAKPWLWVGFVVIVAAIIVAAYNFI
jgi:hypothetical protein